jgi:hypothetical protein
MKKHILFIFMLMITAAATYAQQMNQMQHMQKDTTPKKPMKHDHMQMEGMYHDTIQARNEHDDQPVLA